MGKRKHKDREDERLRKKIKRLKDRLRRLPSSSSEEEYIRTDCERSLSPQSELGPMDIQDSDLDFENGNLRSVKAPAPETTAIMEIPSTDPVSCPQNIDTTAGPSTLPSEILEALGDPKSKDESFGP